MWYKLWFKHTETGKRINGWIAEIDSNNNVHIQFNNDKSSGEEMWLPFRANILTWDQYEKSNWFKEPLSAEELFILKL